MPERRSRISTREAAAATLWTGFDRLNRPVQRRQTNSTGTILATWAYDASGEKGLLDKTTRVQAGLYWGSYVTDITGYDTLNRPLGTTYTIPATVPAGLAGPHTFTNAYHPTNGTTSHTYPAIGGLSAEAVTTTLTNLGAPATLAVNGGAQYVASSTYDGRGRVADRTLGTDTATTDAVYRNYIYDTDQRLTTHGARANTSSGTLQQLDVVTYDNVGNILERREAQIGNSECFGYDSRNRLTSAYTTNGTTCASGTPNTGTSPYNHTYAYSADGRITSRNEQGTTLNYTYLTQGAGSQDPHAVQAVTGNTNDCNASLGGTQNYCYDVNGNMTKRPDTTTTASQTLTWDPEHRLEKVVAGTSTTRFVYDPDGTRILRQTPTDITLYLDGHEVTMNTATSVITARRYYTLGAISVAVRDGGTAKLSYLLGDNLGSVSKTVDAASGTVTKQRYYPYGGIRGTAGSAPTDKGWIGQRKDDSTGLQYLNARYYDPTIGRFLATDPLADLSTVGTLDAYSYGRANPVTLSDPSGLYTCTTAACVFGGSSFFSPSPNAGGPGGGSTGGGGGAGGSSAGTGGDSVADSIAEADAKWHEVDSIKDLLGPNVHAWINDGLLAKRRKSRGEIHGDFWESACVPAYGLCWGEFSESYSDEYEVEANLTALPFGYSEEDLTRTYIVKGVLTEKHVYSSPGYFDPLTGGYDRLSDLDDLLNTDVLGPSHTIERSFEITHYRDANVVAHGQLVPAIVSSDGALTWSIK